MATGGGSSLPLNIPPLVPLLVAAVAVVLYLVYLLARTMASRRVARRTPRPARPGPPETGRSLRAAVEWLRAAPEGRSIEVDGPFGGRHATIRGRAEGVSLSMWLAGRLGERHEIGRDLADPKRRDELLARLERVFPPTSVDVVIRTFEPGEPTGPLD